MSHEGEKAKLESNERCISSVKLWQLLHCNIYRYSLVLHKTISLMNFAYICLMQQFVICIKYFLLEMWIFFKLFLVFIKTLWPCMVKANYFFPLDWWKRECVLLCLSDLWCKLIRTLSGSWNSIAQMSFAVGGWLHVCSLASKVPKRSQTTLTVTRIIKGVKVIGLPDVAHFHWDHNERSTVCVIVVSTDGQQRVIDLFRLSTVWHTFNSCQCSLQSFKLIKSQQHENQFNQSKMY